MQDMGLTPDELSAEIQNLNNIPKEVKDAVLNEFLEASNIIEVGNEGTVTFTSPFTQGASQDLSFEASSVKRPLDFLYKVDPAQLLAIMRREHPQTIAYILSQLKAERSSTILAELAPALQADVARRLSEISKISPDIAAEIEKVLHERLLDIMEGRVDDRQGGEALLDILNRADKYTEQKIISGIVKESPTLAKDIQGKLCTFEDLENIDDDSLKQVLRLADSADIALALRDSPIELAERIYRLLPIDTAKSLRKDSMSLNNSVSQDKVIAAKQQLRNILRGLAALGKIRFVN